MPVPWPTGTAAIASAAIAAAPTEPTQGGHARHCPACGRETFPRTDPAVIVLVTHGDHCLLGRSPRFPPGMYSTLAGFVEPGESLEQTLRREVFEEVGVVARRGRLPRLAALAVPAVPDAGLSRHGAVHGASRSDQDEIEDARWLHRAEIADPSRCPVRLPNRDSIARFLIEEWLAEGG